MIFSSSKGTEKIAQRFALKTIRAFWTKDIEAQNKCCRQLFFEKLLNELETKNIKSIFVFSSSQNFIRLLLNDSILFDTYDGDSITTILLPLEDEKDIQKSDELENYIGKFYNDTTGA